MMSKFAVHMVDNHSGSTVELVLARAVHMVDSFAVRCGGFQNGFTVHRVDSPQSALTFPTDSSIRYLVLAILAALRLESSRIQNRTAAVSAV